MSAALVSAPVLLGCAFGVMAAPPATVDASIDAMVDGIGPSAWVDSAASWPAAPAGSAATV
jgi:hypothetical protein